MFPLRAMTRPTAADIWNIEASLHFAVLSMPLLATPTSNSGPLMKQYKCARGFKTSMVKCGVCSSIPSCFWKCC